MVKWDSILRFINKNLFSFIVFKLNANLKVVKEMIEFFMRLFPRINSNSMKLLLKD